MQTLTLKINGMHCVSCALNIDSELEELPGIESASTNYAKQVTMVSYRPAEVTPAAICRVILSLGYECRVDS